MAELALFDRSKFSTNARTRYGTVEEYLHMLDRMTRLEEQGEIKVHHVRDDYLPTMVRTLSGRSKPIPTIDLWQHKSCGQCGHIPGYVTALYWIMTAASATGFEVPEPQ